MSTSPDSRSEPKEELDPSVRISVMRIRDAGERAATLTKALAG